LLPLGCEAAPAFSADIAQGDAGASSGSKLPRHRGSDWLK